MDATPPRSSSSSFSWSSWSSSPSVLSREQALRVAIIGAVLSGLVLGHLLQNAPTIHVYENFRVEQLIWLPDHDVPFCTRAASCISFKDIRSEIALCIGISPGNAHGWTFMKRELPSQELSFSNAYGP
jgi:hypothetical protein